MPVPRAFKTPPYDVPRLCECERLMMNAFVRICVCVRH